MAGSSGDGYLFASRTSAMLAVVALLGGAALSACASGSSVAARTASQTSIQQQPGTWVQQHPAASPQARSGAWMDYDAKLGKIVLFGAPGLNDTWTYDGGTWTKQSPAASPSARSDAAMAYDPAIGKIVLFGGNTSGGRPLNDTWAFDGSTWVEQRPSAKPPHEGEGEIDMAAMAYDDAIGKMVLIRGNDYPDGTFETWTYDGTTWTEQGTLGPPCEDCLIARLAPSMAYDPAIRKIVLFGGEVAREGPQNDTWTYDGRTWAKLSPAVSPPPRSGASMAYDAQAGKLILFGGAYPDRNDTWSFDGHTWTRESPATAPPRRGHASMAYDQTTQRITLFGGAARDSSHQFGDTWTYESQHS